MTKPEIKRGHRHNMKIIKERWGFLFKPPSSLNKLSFSNLCNIIFNVWLSILCWRLKNTYANGLSKESHDLKVPLWTDSYTPG